MQTPWAQSGSRGCEPGRPDTRGPMRRNSFAAELIRRHSPDPMAYEPVFWLRTVASGLPVANRINRLASVALLVRDQQSPLQRRVRGGI